MKKSRRDAPSTSHSSWAIKGSNDKSKHGIHFSLDLKLKYKVKASNIHGIPLATDNKIVVWHHLYTDSQLCHISAFYRQRYGNPSACSAMLPQPFRTIGKHSGAISTSHSVTSDRCRHLYHNLSYATPRKHAERARWQSFAHLLIIPKGSRN